jgi:hypothetical protein
MRHLWPLTNLGPLHTAGDPRFVAVCPGPFKSGDLKSQPGESVERHDLARLHHLGLSRVEVYGNPGVGLLPQQKLRTVGLLNDTEKPTPNE